MIVGIALFLGALLSARPQVKSLVCTLKKEGAGHQEIKKRVLERIFALTLLFFVLIDAFITNSGDRFFNFKNSSEAYVLSPFSDKMLACGVFYWVLYIIYSLEDRKSCKE